MNKKRRLNFKKFRRYENITAHLEGKSDLKLFNYRALLEIACVCLLKTS